MALHTLPDELLFLIISFVRPSDVEAFTATSRRLHSLGNARLATHRALKARYGSLLVKEDTEGLQTNLTIINHPVKLFNDILNDPWIADYVNYMCFECDSHSLRNAPGNTGADEETTAMLRVLRERSDLLTTAEYNFLSEDQRRGLLDDMTNAEKSSSFIALLPLLINLNRLRLTGYSEKSFMHPNMYDTTQVPTGIILSKLSTVEAYNHDTEGAFYGHNLTLFSQFPAVKKLIGNCVLIEDELEVEYLRESAVEVIALTDSGIRERSALSCILRATKALKEFRYSFGFGMYSYQYLTISCREIVKELKEHVAETLEVLTLTMGEEKQARLIGSLKSFKKLRELEVDFEMLVNDEDEDEDSDIEVTSLESGFHEAPSEDDEETVPRAVDILPTSIERVVLKLQGHEDDVLEFLDGLTTEEGPALPNLKKFVYHGRTLGEDVKAVLKDAGISAGRRQGWPFKAQHDRFWDEDPGLTNM